MADHNLPPIILKLVEAGAICFHTGSRYICPEAAAPDADDDWAVYTEHMTQPHYDVVGRDASIEFADSGSEGDDSVKVLNTDPVINLIFLPEWNKFVRWMNATEFCKANNITSRPERVRIFRSIVEDNIPLQCIQLGRPELRAPSTKETSNEHR
jgi:hypothetical protein